MKKISLKIMIVLSLIVTGSACNTTPKIITVPLDLSDKMPARPTLPRISINEANEIPYMTWVKIAERDRLRRQFAEKLEAIINSTKKEPKP